MILMNMIHVTVIWEDTADAIATANEARIVGEIARDMEGTLRSAFKDFLAARNAHVKALVIASPSRSQGSRSTAIEDK